MNIKETPLIQLVKGNYCKFRLLKNGVMYYDLELITEVSCTVFRFPIAVEDLDGAAIKDKEKAITLMRWIRKAADEDTLVFVSHTLYEDLANA